MFFLNTSRDEALRTSCRDSIPDGRGCDPEGSVSEGRQSRAGNREQAGVSGAEVPGWGVMGEGGGRGTERWRRVGDDVLPGLGAVEKSDG